MMYLLVALLVSGPVRPFVFPDPDPILVANILQAAEATLANRFPAEAHRLQVRMVRLGGDVRDAEALRIAFPSLRTIPRAHTQIKIHRQRLNGTWIANGWALLYIAHFDSVAVVRRKTEADAEVTDADLSFAWVETTDFRGDPLRLSAYRALQENGPLYAARRLSGGETLNADDLRPAYAAAVGAIVMMRYLRGTVRLELSCKARNAGYVGDIIRLYSPETGTTYRARLTGPGTAEWIETL